MDAGNALNVGVTERPRQRFAFARRFTLVCVGLLLLTLLPLGLPVAQAQSAPLPGSFAAAPCPIAPVAGLTIDCGYLTVAESRQRFTGKTIRLAVAIVRSPNANRAPDPVVFLSGGPGQGALNLIPLAGQLFGPILAQRDMIFIDQRGTGYSQPALNCAFTTQTTARLFPVGAKQQNDRPVVLQQLTDALIACGARLRAAGVDLSAYNTIENAADLEDLRIALGYPVWNLYGGSYGTRLALTAMAYRPQTIRSAVLDSVYPLQANFHTDVFTSFNEALNDLFAACANDAACAAAYPQLDKKFDDAVNRLNSDPPAIPLYNLQNNQIIAYTPLTGNDFATIVFQFMYATPIITIMPQVIDRTAAGDYRLISQLLSLLAQSGTGGVSLGMQIAVQCNEDVTFAQPIDFVAARHSHQRVRSLAFSPLFNEAILEICSAWRLTSPNPAENRPVRSDVPALLISGTLDPITPPSYARSAAATLSRSTLITYPRGGHTPSVTSPCLLNTIASFLNNPAQRPTAGCIAQEAPLPFATPQQ